ncbi:MAG: hypothetical protein ACRDPC_13960 [Solirubrobacteraceae bacterium]
MLKPNTGRALSAVGAGLLIVTLFLVWYDIDRSAAEGTTTSTGWDTFPRLRFVVLVGAVATIVTALLRQSREVLAVRTLLGVGLALLIARRIVDPPDISAPVHAQLGVYLALAGALAVALGGLVDSGRRVMESRPGLGGGPGREALPPPGDGDPGGSAAARVPDETAR